MRFYIDKQKIRKYLNNVFKIWSIDIPTPTPTPTPTFALTLDLYNVFDNVYSACNRTDKIGDINVYNNVHPLINNQYLYYNVDEDIYTESYFQNNFNSSTNLYYLRNTSDTVLKVIFEENENAYVLLDDCIVCPAPWMRILLSNDKQILAKDLKPGMLVKTYHEKTMEFGDYEVQSVNILKSKRLLLKFENIDFVCSESHKFYIGEEWIEAKNLNKNDFVKGKKIIEKTKYEHGDVVSIKVNDAHTYICEGFLSHNKSELPPTTTPVSSSLLKIDTMNIIP